MSALAFLDESLSLRIVLTLLHFLWQGSAIALAVVAIACVLRRASAQIRYATNVAAMVVMVTCLAITFTVVDVSQDVEVASVSPAKEDRSVGSALEGNPPTEPLIHEPNVGATAFPDSAAEVADANRSAPSDLRRQPENTIAGVNVAASESSSRKSKNRNNVAARQASETSWLDSAAPYIILLYSGGFALMMLRLAIGLLGGYRLRRSAVPVDDDQLLGKVRRLAKQVGLKTAPLIAYCEQLSVPVVVGTTRAMILLPASLISGLSPSQLGILLTHELAHIRRHDPLVNLFQRLLEAALFFHPAVWFVSRRVSVERENAADDLVVSLGCGRVHYADALVRMAELSAVGRNAMFIHHSTVLAASGSRASELKRRVLRLLAHDHQSQFRMSGMGLATLAVFLCLAASAPLVFAAWAEGTAPQPEAKKSAVDAIAAEKLDGTAPNHEAAEKSAAASKLKWPARLQGEVTDGSEKALGNARVKLSLITHIRNRTNFAQRTLKTVEATTDENGKYEIDTAGFPTELPSPYSIQVMGSAPDHASWETWHFYSGPSGEITAQLPTLRLPNGQVITGQCVDSRGTPVIAAIEGLSSLSSAGVWQRQHGSTDMKGNFRIVAPKDANVALWFLSDLVGYKRVEVPATRTDRPLRVVIEQGTSLSGIVVDEKDEPAAGTLVVLERMEPAMSPGHVHRLRFATKTDDRGRFQLPPARGDFNCFLAQASFTSQRAREPAMLTKNPAPAFAPIAVSLNGTSPKREIKLRVSGQAKVSGIVRLTNGRPARGVSLHVYSMIGENGSGVQLDNLTTDAAGRYELRVPVSSANISIRAYGSNRIAIPVDSAPGLHSENTIQLGEVTKDVTGADFELLTNEERKERESKTVPYPNEALRPDGVIKGKIILRSGPKLDGSPNDLKPLVDKLDKVPVFTVHVGTSTLEFRRAESKAADGLEEATIGEKGEKIYLHKEADVTSEDIAEARVVNDSNGKPAIEIRFTMAGSTKFAKATTEHIGKRLAIVFNGKVISAPTIRSKISTKALITGNFTKEEADGIAKAIMKSKQDKKEKEGESKSSKPDLDDTSELKNDTSPIADIKPVFQPLGHLPDLAKYSMGQGISSDGNVVVGNVRNQRTAFRWTRENGMQALPMLEGGVHHYGQCVSRDGKVIAGFCNHTSRGSEFSTAFIWTEKDGTVSLGHLPGGTRELTVTELQRPGMFLPVGAVPGLPSPRFGSSQAHGMSASGAQVVGASSSKDGMQAFVWTKMAGMRGLGDLDGGEFLSVAQGISADGRVIVGESQSGRGYEAVRWVDSKGPLPIGDFAGGSFNSRAYATSADGRVIVGFGEAEKGCEAFRWEDGKMISLGELPGGRHHSSARGVSADGSVIVGDSHSDHGNEAFVWDAKNGMRSLRDVLINSSTTLAEQLQGWKLTDATGISADGREIAGVGVNPDENWEAWLVSLPPQH